MLPWLLFLLQMSSGGGSGATSGSGGGGTATSDGSSWRFRFPDADIMAEIPLKKRYYGGDDVVIVE
jgi:hypothetical protein